MTTHFHVGESLPTHYAPQYPPQSIHIGLPVPPQICQPVCISGPLHSLFLLPQHFSLNIHNDVYPLVIEVSVPESHIEL